MNSAMFTVPFVNFGMNDFGLFRRQFVDTSLHTVRQLSIHSMFSVYIEFSRKTCFSEKHSVSTHLPKFDSRPYM